MKKPTINTYLDGVTARVHNRRISIIQKDGVTKIQFDFADVDADSPACAHNCVRGKIRQTAIQMNDESMDLFVHAYLAYKRSKLDI
jgi:hypothetical protein